MKTEPKLVRSGTNFDGPRQVPRGLGAVGLMCCLLCLTWGEMAVHGWSLSEVADEPTATIPTWRVRLRSTNWVEWALLEGVGETLARRVVQYQVAHGPFHSPADLRRVKGLGPRTLQRIEFWIDSSR
ncbi:MAG: hypothetical protein KatS3mg114_0683 [Planctomycetaceae bacterium]|nr:MAG: hypothetical protein KatS3mg114_0683 [Planctomycetaceae bacterium]